MRANIGMLLRNLAPVLILAAAVGNLTVGLPRPVSYALAATGALLYVAASKLDPRKK